MLKFIATPGKVKGRPCVAAFVTAGDPAPTKGFRSERGCSTDKSVIVIIALIYSIKKDFLLDLAGTDGRKPVGTIPSDANVNGAFSGFKAEAAVTVDAGVEFRRTALVSPALKLIALEVTTEGPDPDVGTAKTRNALHLGTSTR